VEQSSCCSTETRDRLCRLQETTEDISVPHLMCPRTEGTFTTARRCCDVYVTDSGAGCKTADLLTYLLLTNALSSLPYKLVLHARCMQRQCSRLQPTRVIMLLTCTSLRTGTSSCTACLTRDLTH